MSKGKLIITDEAEEVFIQEGLNLNKFKKRVPHLLIKYVLSFLSTVPKDNYIEDSPNKMLVLDYQKFCHYKRTPYGWWNKMRMEAFHETFKAKYLPVIIENFESKIKRKELDIYTIRNVFSKKHKLPNLDRRGVKHFMTDLKALNPIHYNKKELLALIIVSRCIPSLTATCGCDISLCLGCNKHLCRNHKMVHIGQGKYTCMDCVPDDSEDEDDGCDSFEEAEIWGFGHR